MNEHSHASLTNYYAQASSWNTDRLMAMRSSKRLAWWAAAVVSIIALLEGAALVLLTPLKTVEPYTLMVDRTTGFVEALKPLDQAKVSPDASLTRSFLYQYVIAREGFDFATLTTNYRKVALLSADTARASYLRMMQASNAQSPLQVYPRDTTVDVRVKSVTPIGVHTVLVRFDTIRNDSGTKPAEPKSWIAAVRYRYSNEPMSIEDRFVNPLGFQVTAYRKDPEAPNPEENSSPLATATPLSAASPATSSSGQSAVRLSRTKQ